MTDSIVARGKTRPLFVTIRVASDLGVAGAAGDGKEDELDGIKAPATLGKTRGFGNTVGARGVVDTTGGMIRAWVDVDFAVRDCDGDGGWVTRADEPEGATVV